MTAPRYRLSPYAFARMHVARGRPTVALFDQRRPGAFYPGAKGWAVLEALDGSRDLDGVREALAQRYPSLSLEEIAAFVADVAGHDLVVVGEARQSPVDGGTGGGGGDPPWSGARPDTTVATLPGFALACDGRGSCCRLYPSIVASPLEAARARAAMPDVLGAGEDEARAFFPERGRDRRSLSIALVDGACAYLEAGGGCGVHARSGDASKPLGCRTYPLAYVHDGAAIREAPVMECACVIESGLLAAAPAGPARTKADLDPRVIVERPPARFLVSATSGRYARLDEIRAMSDRFAEAPFEDVPAALFALAAAASSGDLPTSPEAVPPVELDRSRIAACAAALGASAARRRDELAPSGLALAHVVFDAIEIACSILRADVDVVLAVGPELRAVERFVLRGTMFSLDLVRGRDDHLEAALFDRGFRLLVARAMAVALGLAEVDDAALRHPIAALNAVIRGYGLATSA